MSEIVIFFASRHDFTDDKGTHRKGAKAKYFLSDKAEGENKEGMDFMESPMPYELFATLREHTLPARFNVDFKMRPGRENKPEMTLVKAQFVKKVDLFSGAK